MSEQPCIECQGRMGHHPTCSKIGFEEAKKQLKEYYELWLTKETWTRKRSEHGWKASQHWQGKFLQVKNENNKLRKKLYNEEKINRHNKTA